MLLNYKYQYPSVWCVCWFLVSTPEVAGDALSEHTSQTDMYISIHLLARRCDLKVKYYY